MERFVPEKGGVQRRPEAHVVTSVPHGAFQGYHYYVDRASVGCGWYLQSVIDVFASLELKEKFALWSHLARSAPGIKVGHIATIMRGRDRVEPLAA